MVVFPTYMLDSAETSHCCGPSNGTRIVLKDCCWTALSLRNPLEHNSHPVNIAITAL